MNAFAERLAQLQAKHHRDLAATFATLDEENATDFTIMIRAAIDFTSLKPVEMADGLSLSGGTISRWASGRFPHPIIRKLSRDWLVRELNERADMIEAFPSELGTPQDDYIPRRFLPQEMQQPRT